MGARPNLATTRESSNVPVDHQTAVLGFLSETYTFKVFNHAVYGSLSLTTPNPLHFVIFKKLGYSILGPSNDPADLCFHVGQIAYWFLKVLVVSLY